jgi:hypothetical protein
VCLPVVCLYYGWLLCAASLSYLTKGITAALLAPSVPTGVVCSRICSQHVPVSVVVQSVS